MESLNKLNVIKVNQLNNDNTYIPVDSNVWKSPNKISISDIVSVIQTAKLSEQIDNISIVVDIETGKLKVVFPTIVNYPKHNVFYEPFIDHNVSINRLPKNTIDISSMHMCIDENYLYIWVKNKWKRIPLCDWL